MQGKEQQACISRQPSMRDNKGGLGGALSGAEGEQVLLRVVRGGVLVGQDVVGHHPHSRGLEGRAGERVAARQRRAGRHGFSLCRRRLPGSRLPMRAAAPPAISEMSVFGHQSNVSNRVDCLAFLANATATCIPKMPA